MIGIKVATSKAGCLWPAGHWKPLFDSVCRGGAKSDPRIRYRDLSPYLAPLIRERDGRFYPTSESQCAGGDDTAVSSLQITRVCAGAESLKFYPPESPDVTGWPWFDFSFFGTIGNAKYERQSLQNRLDLAARQHELLQGGQTQENCGCTSSSRRRAATETSTILQTPSCRSSTSSCPASLAFSCLDCARSRSRRAALRVDGLGPARLAVQCRLTIAWSRQTRAGLS
jgi:hypothetical protein